MYLLYFLSVLLMTAIIVTRKCDMIVCSSHFSIISRESRTKFWTSSHDIIVIREPTMIAYGSCSAGSEFSDL